ncbi:unnamed protein product [Calypogeia fissa]
MQTMTGTRNLGSSHRIRALPSISVHPHLKPNSVIYDPVGRFSVSKFTVISTSSRWRTHSCQPLGSRHAFLDNMDSSVGFGGSGGAARPAKGHSTSTEFRNFGRLVGLAVRKSAEPSSKAEELVSVPTLSEGEPIAQISDELERRHVDRLFSNLNGTTLKHEPGSLSGSILLVAGTTVGAGILAIPAATQDAGFVASAATCVACWAYMVLTGLLVAEVNINTMCELGSGGVSLVSMASRTLGKTGVRVACVTYLFIHYALLVAYVARSSEIVSTAIGSPLWLSGFVFTGTLGGLCYFCSQQKIDIVNGALVAGIIVSFTGLVGLAAGGLELDSLLRINFAAAPSSIPIIALSFVYQNVVPVVCTSLEGDLAKIRTTIVLGTAIPLLMFIAWDAVILGNVSFDPNGVTQGVVDPLLALESSNGIVAPLVKVFSLLAVATSYIGFVLGLSDFLSDWLKMPAGGSRKSVPYILTLFPPLALALTYPGIFFDALDFAGTYGVLVLFGILPAAMAWSERYSDRCLPPATPPLVPGGKLTLVAVIGFAVVIISSEVLEQVLR